MPASESAEGRRDAYRDHVAALSDVALANLAGHLTGNLSDARAALDAGESGRAVPFLIVRDEDRSALRRSLVTLIAGHALAVAELGRRGYDVCPDCGLIVTGRGDAGGHFTDCSAGDHPEMSRPAAVPDEGHAGYWPHDRD